MRYELCGWRLAGDGRVRPVYPVLIDGEVVWHFREERGALLKPVDWEPEPEDMGVMLYYSDDPESAYIWTRAVYWNDDGTCPWPNAEPTGGIPMATAKYDCALYTPPPERRPKTDAEVQRDIDHHYEQVKRGMLGHEIRCAARNHGLLDDAQVATLRSTCESALRGLRRGGECGRDLCEENRWGCDE